MPLVAIGTQPLRNGATVVKLAQQVDGVVVDQGELHVLMHRDGSLAAVSGTLLPAVARTVGDPQVRHRGTLGGALAHADPASDLPAAVLALDGTVVLRGPRGERRGSTHDGPGKPDR